MSAIALLLARMGHRVSGSDIKESAVLERLVAAGVEVHVGNRAEHVPRRRRRGRLLHRDSRAERRARRRARAGHPGAAPLGRAGRARRDPAHDRGRGLARQDHDVVDARAHPAQRGLVAELRDRRRGERGGRNAAFGEGEWLVVEADESDGTFLHLAPRGRDRHQRRARPSRLLRRLRRAPAAFEQFVDGVPGPSCAAPTTRSRRASRHAAGVRTYGFAPGADYRIVEVDLAGDVDRFTLAAGGERLGELVVPLGVKASTNAAGATAIALELGVPFPAIAEALRGFGGVARRFQYRGERDGVTFIDDYAHLPSEVAAAIAAARQGPWRRVVVVFQPHRYTRTASLWQDFADAFADADTLVLTDVYPAGETPIPGVSGRLVLHAVLDHPDAAGHVPPAPRRPRRRPAATGPARATSC